MSKRPPTARSSLFPIVGIGASAGGLAAVTELLKELPGGIGAAVVVIQHLDPDHGSLTGEILSRISPLPVSEVTDEGKGAVFTVTLPCAPPRLAAGATSGDAQSTALKNEGPVTLNGLRVLIIDDDEGTRLALSELLGAAGAQVLSVGSAEQGLTAIGSDRPEVVLCDLAMPGSDGFSLIRAVRALDPGQGGRLPVVALTAYADSDTVRRCLDAGFDAHLAKPVDIADLARLIAKLAGRLQLIRSKTELD